MRLDGARALVTGCSSGIGRATALELARQGAEVWATAREPRSLEELRLSGVHVARLDVTCPTDVERVIREVTSIDVLVNNAGYGVEGAIEEIEDETLRAQYETNVFAVWRLCRAVLPEMRRRRHGAIVNVSSFGAHVPFPGIGAYRSSKFALDGMTWTLHLEVSHFGIRVIAIEPGLTETAFNDNAKVGEPAGEDASPYDEMREQIRFVYAKMSPTALAPETVARTIVTELSADSGPLHVPIGEDAKRMIAAVAAGEQAFQRYLVKELGFGWHPLVQEPRVVE